MSYTGQTPDTEPAGQWVKQGACRKDPDAMFPGSLAAEIEYAKAICHSCPVIEQCKQWALETRQGLGVWGGLSEGDRQSIRRRSRARTRTRPAAPLRPAPASTLEEAFHRRATRAEGGHLLWNGTPRLKFQGGDYTASHVAFVIGHGREPNGLVRRTCGVAACMTHLADEAIRDSAARCGTRPGYQRHRKNGEKACDACRQANADADNRLRRTGTTKELAS